MSRSFLLGLIVGIVANLIPDAVTAVDHYRRNEQSRPVILAAYSIAAAVILFLLMDAKND